MGDIVRRHALLITAIVLFLSSFQLMHLSVSNPSFPRMGARVVVSALFPMERLHHEASESVKIFMEPLRVVNGR